MLNNIHAHKVTGGRIVKEDGSTMNLGDSIERIEDSRTQGVMKESRKVKFDGVDVVVVNEVKSYNSEFIDISKYKKIDFFIKNGVYAKGWPMEISIVPEVGSGPEVKYETAMFYDWNEERWRTSHQDGASVPISQSPNALQILSTHPNAYWLRELSAMRVRLRVTISPNLELDKDSQFEIWFVGELNV